MKTRITLGAALLLALGTSVANSDLYSRSHGSSATHSYSPEAVSTGQVEATPEMIAMWKATAASSDYIAPKVPL